MGAAEWEFSQDSRRGTIRVDRHSSRKSTGKMRRHNRTAAPAAEKSMHRQSHLLIAVVAARLLPMSAALSAAVVWSVLHFLPRPVHWWAAAWSGGVPALALAIVASVILWHRSVWNYDGERFTCCSGVLTRRELSLQREQIVHVSQTVTPLTSLFRCGWLTIRTAAKDNATRLLLPERECAFLCRELMPASSGRFHSYRAAPPSLWLAALGGEGTAAFVSAAVSSFSVLRDTVGSELSSRLSQVMQLRGIPWAAAAAVAAVWLAKLLHTRLTFGRMNHYRRADLLTLERGVISRHRDCINRRDVCGLDTRFSLPALLARRQSCSLLTPDGRLLSWLPPVDERRLRIECAVVSPHSARVCTVSPLSEGISYAAGRWALCLCVLPLTSLVRRIFPSWDGAFYVIGLTAAALLMWRALTSTVCARRADLAVFADCVEVTGVRRLTIHTLRIFRPSVGMIRITQSPLSRILGRCTVRVTPRGKAASLACIKLPFERTVAACERVVK